MFEFEACEVFETKELTFVNDCFKYERNEEIGHYRQTLFNVKLRKSCFGQLPKAAFFILSPPISAY